MLVAFALMALTLLLAQPAVTLPPDEDVAAAKDWLVRVQRLSFATDREYCGYLGHTADGAILVTEMVRGGHDGCTPAMPDSQVSLIASLHSHGAYDPDVPAEFPTSRDMESDAREGVNGYISTPGGRLWYIDSTAMIAVQVCGLGCLPQDPAFHPGDDGAIRSRYTHDGLRMLEIPD
ncbi:DUF4329 domain-containing protein [Sedimentitalea todarodis]|uniref:DUF4329 domain-containing protein n=1 Tax=Sedimentitalea todarodis TaxID=1631240 RepID=A0ABU3VFL4_9RHOB|nr:DUF4329 domain-containing protein [Sedimentitalea todarodis]MDU9004972.1 DUF4329 domain-containing protein [Sedimentitalea todarodis]